VARGLVASAPPWYPAKWGKGKSANIPIPPSGDPETVTQMAILDQAWFGPKRVLFCFWRWHTHWITLHVVTWAYSARKWWGFCTIGYPNYAKASSRGDHYPSRGAVPV